MRRTKYYIYWPTSSRDFHLIFLEGSAPALSPRFSEFFCWLRNKTPTSSSAERTPWNIIPSYFALQPYFVHFIVHIIKYATQLYLPRKQRHLKLNISLFCTYIRHVACVNIFSMCEIVFRMSWTRKSILSEGFSKKKVLSETQTFQ